MTASLRLDDELLHILQILGNRLQKFNRFISFHLSVSSFSSPGLSFLVVEMMRAAEFAQLTVSYENQHFILTLQNPCANLVHGLVDEYGIKHGIGL